MINENNKAIFELEELASSVLELKNEVIPRRPIIIEFCGSPKSGKTSCINSLDLFLRRNNFRTKILTERASICPVQNKYDPYFNIWTVTSAIAELSEMLSNHSKDYDVIILDRGIFDALCWFSWLLKRKHLEILNYNSLESFLTMDSWRSAIDLIYVFTASPDTSLNREFANLLTRKTGSIMHPDILISYKETIGEMIPKYETKFKKIEHLDTSEFDLNTVNYKVTKNILNILHDNTSERVGYISRNELNESLSQVFDFEELHNCSNKLQFGIRRYVEESSEKVQPIPIFVITNKERTKVLVVKKNKNRTSENSPESNKSLLYLGGHIRQEDCIEADETNLLSVVRYTLHREIKEEICFDYFVDINDIPFCIWVREKERSEQHLALCYVIEVDFDTFKFKLDKNEFATGSPKSGMIQAVADISNKFLDLEDWSQVILQKVFEYKPIATQDDVFDAVKYPSVDASQKRESTGSGNKATS